MNYAGRCTNTDVSTSDIYTFLKDALSQVSINFPFRGINVFENNDFKYTNDSNGDVNFFSGEEKIYYKEKLVYELKYHGGGVS